MDLYYAPNEKHPCCPHCGEELDLMGHGTADDLVIPGRVGRASRSVDECHACDEEFSAELTEDGRIFITEA